MSPGFIIACIILFVIAFGVIIYCGEFTCNSDEENNVESVCSNDSTVIENPIR